jgi:predicted alpha/beta-hydrolase family hydrolase
VEVVRFEFPYMAARRANGKRRPPDRLEALLSSWERMIHRYSNAAMPLFIGGKSMGGRVASVWAADHTEGHCRGVICFGYPFHPPRKPENLRIAHLSRCRIPLLIVQGERDPLGSTAEVAAYDLAGPMTFCWLASADHDLKPLRRSGYTHRQHLDTAADAAASFIRSALSASAP